MVFKKSLRFAGSLAKQLRSWKLVEVKGDDTDPLVQYMRKQIKDYADPEHRYNLNRSDMFSVVGKEVGSSIDQVKDSFKLLPKKIRSKILGDQ